MGSSPLARGALSISFSTASSVRIIPACAGSTLSSSVGMTRDRDHPRLRGEHLPCPHCGGEAEGSPPLARGAQPAGAGLAGSGGIIPACAGSTVMAEPSCAPSLDHPRLRGEHEPHSTWPESAEGSSPLARGALGQVRRARAPTGIIPACAGSTSQLARRSWDSRDHPRLRGEHAVWYVEHGFGVGSSPLAREHPLSFFVSSCPPGSSPLARGAQKEQTTDGRVRGIIPACAGSTRPPASLASRRWDHPRLRGEHESRSLLACSLTGSSPLARGAHLADAAGEGADGIIPACAGSTTSGSQGRPSAGDHPRLRGEHLFQPPLLMVCWGSSPLARGARRGSGNHRRYGGIIPLARGALNPVTLRTGGGGIIPACAGSTPHR